MKKWIIIGLLALVFLYGDMAPFKSVDAGELCVVETLFVSQNRGEIMLQSGQAEGQGADIASALEDMSNSAPGQLFLKQTKRVVFCQGAEEAANPLTLPTEIPLGAKVYRTEYSADVLLKDLAGFEKRLNAQEKTVQAIPNLARVKNYLLQEA